MNNTPKNPMALQLNSLEIKRNMYKFDYDNIPAGGLAGKIAFSNKDGHEMTFVLRNDQIQKILSIVSEAMVNTVNDLAQNLTKDIIEATPVLLTDGTK